ncbi:hypothetical protein [Variovorax sp. OV700]|uniref:hypothetical protein n=1 Tax=Variovorax sp. OV700 TaxID=1882826 RepID=UPI00087F6D72|nr:hypothetical protein [Variovorax sp. OV700]SDI77352.1 hypothetical protein SAMN05444748_10794 [Variovorax sp. OV700]
MEWTTAASLVIRLGKQGYDKRHSIQKYWTRTKAYLDVGRTQVVVTGHANGGKSILVAQMHGRARDWIAEELPRESRMVEVDAISLGEWAKLVRVLPGQTGYRTHGEIEAFEGNEELEGVIHVVNFGYVHPRNPVVAEALIKNDGLDTVEKLRAANLDSEIQTLTALLTDVRKAHVRHRRPKWLVIAVNKVDLFADRRDEALRFYHPSGQGAFSKVLREFQNEVGQNNFPIYVLQACAFETAFNWNGATIDSGLKKQEQVEILREFVETVAVVSEMHK